MSDTPQGGWWKAKDGKWYPPETHPDFTSIATAEVPAGPPAAGWWQANDGNWYPPETNPGQVDSTIDLTEGAGNERGATVAEPARSSTEQVASAHAMGGEGGSTMWDLTPDGPSDRSERPAADPTVPGIPPQEAPVAQPPPVEPRPSLFVAPPLPGAADAGAAPATNGNGSDVAATWGPPPGSSDPAGPADRPTPVQESPMPVETTPLDLTPLAEADGVAELVQDDPDAPLPGWRKGADGAWYPPNQEPPTKSAVFPNANRPSGPSVLDSAPGPARSSSSTKRSKTPLIVAGVAALLLLVVGLAVFVLGGGDDPEPVAKDAPSTTSTTAPPTTVAGPPPAQVSGTTSGTVDVGRDVSEQYLALVTFDGSGAFSARLLDAEGEVSQELVPSGETGKYLGVVPVNFADGQSFRSVQVDGEGAWAVTFAVLSSAESMSTDSGSAYDGTGDQVLAFAAERPTQVRVACADCGSLIEVMAWSDGATGAEDLPLVGGEVVVPEGTTYLQVIARGAAGASGANWTVAVV